MLKKLIYRYLKRRHYWRMVEFDELSELYTTQFLRSLSISLVGIFVPVYLYKLGYTITEIALFFVVWFAVRPLFSWMTAKIIASIGPKHTMILATMVQILYLGLVLTLQTMQWPLFLLGIIGSIYYGMYRMAFDVDFSKVKHTENGGKEVGYLQMFEKVGGVVGPVLGGLIAGYYDPRYTIALAIFALVLSSFPLLATAEPVKKHQIIVLKGFPFRRYRRSLALSGAYQVQEVASFIYWPLFLGAFVLVEGTYQILGALTSFSMLIALLTAYVIGKLIDNNKGRQLLNVGAVLNAMIQLIKPFISTVAGAFAVNLVKEPATAMYRMPFMKGRYDEADSLPGYRIVYFMYVELVIAVSNVMIWGFVAVFSYYVDAKMALQISFVIASLASLSLVLQKFNALRR